MPLSIESDYNRYTDDEDDYVHNPPPDSSHHHHHHASHRKRCRHHQTSDSSYEMINRAGVLRRIFDITPDEIEDLQHKHSFVYIMLHPKSQAWQSEVFKRFITTIIVIDLLAFFISTESAVHDPNEFLFRLIEGTTSVLFLIEYVARLTTCTENDKYGSMGPIMGRLRWMMSPAAIIDIVATFPWFLELATGWKIPNLTYLRVFRVFRILKTDGYNMAFGACYRVLYFNREILWVAILVCMFLVILSSMLLYYLRPRNVDESLFQSIPSTIFLSVLMLTGQDSFIRSSQYMPWYTKMVVAFTGALSVAMFAIPVSLLTWGFEAEAERCARRTRAVIKRAQSNATKDDATKDGEEPAPIEKMNSDEEYLKIIANESSDSGVGVESDEKRSAKLNDLTELYLRNDDDRSKYIALVNFLARPLADPQLMSDPISHERLTNDVSEMRYRVTHLESRLVDMSSKLDTVCNLLMERKMELQSVI